MVLLTETRAKEFYIHIPCDNSRIDDLLYGSKMTIPSMTALN